MSSTINGIRATGAEADLPPTATGDRGARHSRMVLRSYPAPQWSYEKVHAEPTYGFGGIGTRGESIVKGEILRHIEACDVESIPGDRSVELLALRRNPESQAAQLRRTVPLLLAGILGEVSGAILEFGMRCRADGMVGLDLTASAGDATAVVVQEMAGVLAPVAETAVVSGDTGVADGVLWPVTPEIGRTRLGFAAENGPAHTHVVSGDLEATDESLDVLGVLAALPGQGLVVRLRAVDGSARRWEAQLAVVTDGQSPSLRLRAALRRRFPGLRVGDLPSSDPVWLQVESADLPRVLAIPVAGPQAPAGTYIGAAAPIAVLPARPGGSAIAAPGVRIGHAVTTGGHSHPVELTVAERLRHIHVLGRTGTGKSSMLAAMAHEIAAGPGGALIADPHGQLCDRVLAELPDSARERVWVIRCGDFENAVPLNPLADTDPVRREIAIDEICDCFQYLFDKRATGIVGPRFRERVAMALRAISAVHGPRTSVLDVPMALADDHFMAAAVSQCDDARVRAWWSNDKVARRSNDYGEVVSWVNSKFEALASTAAMRAILGSGADAIDFARAMDDGRIILLDLSKSLLGESASRLLGFLYLNRVWSAALRREHPDRPFTVIVDEAQKVISGALSDMLAEGRKFGLSVTLAQQHLEQFDEDLGPAVDGNVSTTVAFRCGVSDAAVLHQRFGGLVDPSVLVTLPDLAAVCLRAAVSGPAHPHTLFVDHNARVTRRVGPDLDRHVDEVMRSTHTALVEPYRDITKAAAQGVSNVNTLPGTPSAATKVPPKPKPKPTARAASVVKTVAQQCDSPPAGGTVDFLDDWIRRRGYGQQEKDSGLLEDDANKSHSDGGGAASD
jgi:hypothetical protein